MRREAFSEFLGTMLLVAIVVGSGIAAQRLSPDDVGIQLLENSLATAGGLAVLIMILAPVSGAHFNPVVSLAAAWFDNAEPDTAAGERRRYKTAIFICSQMAGGVAGAVLANVMFEVSTSWSGKDRAEVGTFVAEIVATAGLILVIFGLTRGGRGHLVPGAVGMYIGAGYWFTSSTSFANPAVTVGRMFSDTFAGIAPMSVAPFVIAQVIGAALGVLISIYLFPRVLTPEVGESHA